jgi:hypothetical protein
MVRKLPPPVKVTKKTTLPVPETVVRRRTKVSTVVNPRWRTRNSARVSTRVARRVAVGRAAGRSPDLVLVIYTLLVNTMM